MESVASQQAAMAMGVGLGEQPQLLLRNPIEEMMSRCRMLEFDSNNKRTLIADTKMKSERAKATLSTLLEHVAQRGIIVEKPHTDLSFGVETNFCEQAIQFCEQMMLFSQHISERITSNEATQ